MQRHPVLCGLECANTRTQLGKYRVWIRRNQITRISRLGKKMF